ncbi:MAG TPA: FAD-dependent oxidoreductase [Pyrinomonadaceae bacterium]|jgi:monoamine oxidase
MNQKSNRRDFLRLNAAGAFVSLAFPPTSLSSTGLRRDGQYQKREKIAVIGAGLAGLAAAYELDNLGYETVVLEAQMRAGGRVQTLREAFSDGLYAEAGAMAIADVDKFTLDYAKKFNLPLQKTNPTGAPRRFFVRGKWLTNPQITPYALNANEKRVGLEELYLHYASTGIKQIGNTELKSWSPAAFTELDKLTVSEYLRKQGASKDAIEFLRLTELGLYGDGVDSSSALGVLLGEAHYINAEKFYAIQGGNDLLPKAFAKRLADKIQYGAAVSGLAQNENGVKIIGNRKGFSFVLEADRVVCAVPLTVLGKMEITPPLSQAKRRAASQLKYSSVSRVYLQSRTRVWQKYYQTVRATTDDPRVVYEDQTDTQPKSRRGIVESHTFGAEARQIAALTEKERLRQSVQQLEKLFPDYEKEFEGGTSKCWDDDEFSQGAYVDYQRGQMIEHFAHIASPEGRIYFAGEHTSKMFASMEGALESGRRIVAEIHLSRGK